MTEYPSPLDKRRAGVLLHPTSLPGKHGNGDLGSEAYQFVDFLRENGFSVWQTLPLGPVHADLSPYSAISVHAGNEHLVDMQWLVDRGWLAGSWPRAPGESDKDYRTRIRRAAHAGFLELNDEDEVRALRHFCDEHQHWLDDYALFRVLHDRYDSQPWWEWPTALRSRETGALLVAQEKYREDLACVRFEQFVFYQQWHSLRNYANQSGILLFGDIPLFVAEDSADAWSCQECFRLDKNGRPLVVAGVPPDYFSATGQRWGNPHYRWKEMENDGFSWWVSRFATQLDLFDWLRIDHFRGLQASWEIDAAEETAINGRWIDVPGDALLATLYDRFHRLPIIAEDLGVITHEVEALRDKYALPGMKILQFAFSGGDDNPYLPDQHVENGVVYTGTHDNDTSVGWYQQIGRDEKNRLFEVLDCHEDSGLDCLYEAAIASVARLCIFPMQDLLELGSEARMNLPGTEGEPNWRWQFSWQQVSDRRMQWFKEQLKKHHRS